MKAYARIADGFKGQEFFLLPRGIIEKLATYPLVTGLHLCGAGYFPQARYHYIERPQGFPDHILIYAVEGSGWYSTGGVDHVLEKDSLLLVPANTPHAYGANRKSPWTIYWLTFAGDISGEYLSYVQDNNNQTPVATAIRANVINLFGELFQVLHQGHGARNLVYGAKILEHLLGLLFLHNEALATGPGIMRFRDITRSIHHMRKNLHRNLTLRELAAQTNMSAVQFWRLFKRQTGHAPVDYFIRMKIQLACQHLSTTDKPLKVIAQSLGYDDYYYFSRVFRKVMGMPPSDYQREAMTSDLPASKSSSRRP